jgi:hypothetical protein
LYGTEGVVVTGIFFPGKIGGNGSGKKTAIESAH